MPEFLRLTMPLWEIGLRATITYVALVVVLRVVAKRNVGHISPNDMLTLIVIGALGTDAIAGGSQSVGDILLMILVVIFWGGLLDRLEYHFPFVQRLLRDRQTALIEDGRFIRPNMRRELVTEQELMAVLRKQGFDDPAQVRSACLEADGEISVIPKGARPEGVSD